MLCSIIHRRWISLVGRTILCWISAFGFAFECSAHPSDGDDEKSKECSKAVCVRNDLRDALLSPVKVPLHFFGGSHPVREIGAGAFETSLREGLQLEKFAMLGVQFARSWNLLAHSFFPPITDDDLRLGLSRETSVQW